VSWDNSLILNPQRHIHKRCAQFQKWTMNINDWVYSYSKGLWLITKIVNVDELFPIGTTRTSVFVKRLLNEKGKRSFSMESVHPSFIRALTASDKAVVDSFIKENPKVFNEFNTYYKQIDSILNLAFYVKDEEERTKFKEFSRDKFSNIQNGLNDTQIVKILEEKRNDSRSSIRNITLQFVSVDSEVFENRLRYTMLNILDF
jgi:hypothetical protein